MQANTLVIFKSYLIHDIAASHLKSEKICRLFPAMVGGALGGGGEGGKVTGNSFDHLDLKRSELARLRASSLSQSHYM
jgi:hypothetical protein